MNGAQGGAGREARGKAALGSGMDLTWHQAHDLTWGRYSKAGGMAWVEASGPSHNKSILVQHCCLTQRLTSSLVLSQSKGNADNAEHGFVCHKPDMDSLKIVHHDT